MRGPQSLQVVGLTDAVVDDRAVVGLIRLFVAHVAGAHLEQFGCGSGVFATGDPLDDRGDGLVARHTVELGAVAEAEAHRVGLDVPVAGHAA